jgi:hypothetical protein
MFGESVRREPLTPRNSASKHLSRKSGATADEHVGISSTGKGPAASQDHAFEMEENNPTLAQEQPAARGEAKQPYEGTVSLAREELRTTDQISEADSVLAQRARDLTRLQADLELREYQVWRARFDAILMRR